VARTVRRGLLWGLLIAAVVAVVGATVIQRWRRPEPPPVLYRLPAFSLVNRDGRATTLKDLADTPWIADFIFTRCPASCPMMSARLARLDRELPRDRLDRGVRLVSISVDPEHDTPQVLQRYAASFHASDRWLFLTGDGPQIYRLSKEGFKLAVDASPQPAAGTAEPILHSTRFVLVDGEGGIRGFYDGFDEASMRKLVRDLSALAE